MDGLFTYADIFADWISQLQIYWQFLNTNVLTVFDNALNNPIPNLGKGLLLLVRTLIFNLGFGEFTLLSFIFSIMGIGFSIYFVISILTWLFNIIT